MNPPADQPTNSDAIRAEIDQTRHRMDETIDALGNRFKGRHLVDEALHFFRTQTQDGTMNKVKDTLTRSANSAANSVIDTVKTNPIPLVLIGAGLAYYLFNRSRVGSAAQEPPAEDFRDYRYPAMADGDFDWAGDQGGNKAGNAESGQGSGASGKVAQLAQGVGESLHEMSDTVRDKAQAVAEGTKQMGAQVAERSRQLYRDGKDRVASTIDRHPLESGLACLAVGLLVGIALPTSQKVRQKIGPQARGLRRRAGSMVASGRQVVRRAAEAARDEARSQGLTIDSLKNKAADVGRVATGAAQNEAVEQGLPA